MSDNCGWVQDEDGVWATGCGHWFETTDGTPSENEFKFCCYCGKSLTEDEYEEEQP